MGAKINQTSSNKTIEIDQRSIKNLSKSSLGVVGPKSDEGTSFGGISRGRFDAHCRFGSFLACKMEPRLSKKRARNRLIVCLVPPENDFVDDLGNLGSKMKACQYQKH